VVKKNSNLLSILKTYMTWYGEQTTGKRFPDMQFPNCSIWMTLISKHVCLRHRHVVMTKYSYSVCACVRMYVLVRLCVLGYVLIYVYKGSCVNSNNINYERKEQHGRATLRPHNQPCPKLLPPKILLTSHNGSSVMRKATLRIQAG
jgi:hypothetical protein